MYEQLELQNGARIVSERVPGVRTAAMGLWIGAGSRDEKASEAGSAHFIEHMLFKGTERRTASELAEDMDAIGGQFNAFTTRENTCFYARVPDYHLARAADILEDMFFSSKLADSDVELERGVINEEIDMYEDTPEDLVAERLISGSFPGALGRPVLGRKKTLAGMSGRSLRDFMDKSYIPSRTVVAVAGSFDDGLVEGLAERFSAPAPVKRAKPKNVAFSPCLTLKRKAVEQNHICLGFEAPDAESGERFALQLLNGVLGGGMSSRLFQTVREKYGLCYSIYSFTAAFSGAGLLGVCTALGAGTEERALGLIKDEIARLLDAGVTEAELSRAREQVKASLLMGLESTSTRMMRLGGGVLTLGRCMEADEAVSRYDAVTADEVLALTRRILDMDRVSFSAVGRVAEAEKWAALLKA